MTSPLTIHCIVKNEEYFVGPALRSVLPYAVRAFVYDTGSTDATTRIIRALMKEFPGKITFEEKGAADKARHTALRQEMLDRTDTEWCMIVDGDEVWTTRGMEEATGVIAQDASASFMVAPFYLCVGDVYHASKREGKFDVLGRQGNYAIRFFRNTPELAWKGAYEHDTLVNKNDEAAFTRRNTVFLKEKFWHATHLARSSRDACDYSSGGTRKEKRRLTYTWIGVPISEPVPEAFGQNPEQTYALPQWRSLLNFIKLCAQHYVMP
jgi:glycosyltransferase involved in cell wall biosynthesis